MASSAVEMQLGVAGQSASDLVPLKSRGPRPDGRGEAPIESSEARTATLTELRTSSL